MEYTAAVITVSDLGSRGQRVDTSGPAVVKMLEEAGYRVVHTQIVPDEQAEISAVLKKWRSPTTSQNWIRCQPRNW